ncbi:glycosyltransferase [Methanobrevibacter sp.]|uniref:glycosyltransferase n=1 Tax=Methanobrevibacter sp. TaxID=66852 RepID=UPI0026DEAE66|nr:glycosyltransferase [Methanobrevibacter sp.]MDO5859638.1 glycosyltransferase [Methanobrevibacter sp.]
MAKITIIIPIKGNEADLEKTFDSILNQTLGFENIEIIFIDNNSQNKIVRKWMHDYDNVKVIPACETDCSMSKYYNFCIEDSKADFIMFLNPKNTLLKNSCSILYNNILDCDFVLANFNNVADGEIIKNNWDFLTFKDNVIEIDNPSDCQNIFKILDSLENKIFRKDVLIENDIRFLNMQNHDTIFLNQCILSSDRIRVIDTPISDMADFGESPVLGDKKSFSMHINYLKKLYSLLIGTPFVHHSLIPLNGWSRQLLASDLSILDKIDLIGFAKFLFDELYKRKVHCDSDLKDFLNLIHSNDILKAAIYSKDYSSNISSSDIKNRTIFTLSRGLNEEMHGLLKASFDKANLFYEHGYNVVTLNITPLKNFKYILENHYNLGNLNRNIPSINIYDYYSQKNTLDFDIDSEIEYDERYVCISKENSDDSSIIKYYDCKTLKECVKRNLVKEELYISGYRALKKVYSKGKFKCEYYYTPDQFNYLYINKENKKVTLFDRFCDNYITFNQLEEFEDYFVNEICLNESEKPILISDCSNVSPSIKNISFDVAYKIGVSHNNPYNEPYCYGSTRWYLASLEEFEDEDASVILTESARNDFLKEFGADNFVVIPNFISDRDVERSDRNFGKENNVISIFATIAPRKNISHLVEAFADVVKKHENAILRIYGRVLHPTEIKEKEKLQNLAEELGITDSIKFMGHVDNVYEEMNKSAATVLSSNIEGLPIVILESMINRTPVVSYDINYGPRDVIVNGVNGYVVEQFNIAELSKALIKILDDPQKAQKMGDHARQHVIDNFSADVVFNKWESLFKDIYLKDMDRDSRIDLYR